MASPRYTLNIKPEDLQPEQPKHEMTGKEKRENFWFYHKWHVIVGIVAALMVFSFVWEIATQVHPDYTIGILTTTGVPMGTGEALAEQLKPYFDDRNGDGEVVVSVMEYTIGKDADSIADPNVQMANITKLSGDIDGGAGETVRRSRRWSWARRRTSTVRRGMITRHFCRTTSWCPAFIRAPSWKRMRTPPRITKRRCRCSIL